MIRVFLADLVHNTTVLANDCMPLNVGYVKAVIDKELGGACETTLYKYPERLEAALVDRPPDVLMLSNYVWNEALSLAFAKLTKLISPETLVVMGGPNLALEPELQIEFMRARPSIDAYVLGEGEFSSARLLQEFADSGSVEKLRARDLPFALHRNIDGNICVGQAPQRMRAIDDIPSPWLNGSMDEFFDGQLAPIIETNRGCPFKCTFCVQGGDWYTKVNYFDLDRVKEEIRYIGKMIRAKSPKTTYLRIADSNFGMFERDVEISREIGKAQREYQWPTFVDATTGKNRPERVIAALGEANNAIVMYTSVQSLDPEVLSNIKRQNIKLDAYREIQMTVHGRGLRSLTELIIGLPGETLESHLKAIGEVIDAGSRQITAYQAMLLHGSELGTLESRTKWGLRTNFRVLPRNFGKYARQDVFEVEEIVTSTSTLSFKEYLEARVYHFFVATVINSRQFDPLVSYLHNLGFPPSLVLKALVESNKAAWPQFADLIANFVSETQSELFPSKEECIRFYTDEENYEALRTGQIGNNLLFKYRSLATTVNLPVTVSFIFAAISKELTKHNIALPSDFAEFWEQLEQFTKLRVAHGVSVVDILKPQVSTLAYDFAKWLSDDCTKEVAPYRFQHPRTLEFALTETSRNNIERAYAVWKGDSLLSTAKLLTRIHSEDFIRECKVC